jgi:hypothetical protein
MLFLLQRYQKQLQIQEQKNVMGDLMSYADIWFTMYIGQCGSRELGIPLPAKTKQRLLQHKTNDEIMLQRIKIPGKAILPILSDTVCCLSWQPNKDRCNLLLQIPGMNGQKAKNCFEAKSRQNLSSADTVIIAVNLFDGDCDIGVLVLSNCCQFWGKIAHNQRKGKS